MTVWTLLLIALGTSADAFAVALGRGLHLPTLTAVRVGLIALVFGAFQAGMPLLGWLLGSTFAESISGVDHWIAFGLLALVGGKMLWEAFHPDDADEDTSGDTDVLDLKVLLVLGVATSIDALAVGVSLSFVAVSIGWAVLLIGVVTALVSAAGVVIGHRVGIRWGRPAEIVGGVVLILIGVSIVLEHLGVW